MTIVLVVAVALEMAGALMIATRPASEARAATAPAGQGFTLNSGDLRFILKQIKIAEHHATTESGPGEPLVGPGPFQIANPLLPYGLRTVDGSENNLQPGQNTFGASHQLFPRLVPGSFKDAEDSTIPGLGPVGPPGATSYTQKSGNVVDSRPRTISNLIVDQTSGNPAAVVAAGRPHRTFLGEPSIPCEAPNADPATCTPAHHTLFIPNVTTDVGLSPPYNSWFTLFGQFFDHGVDFTSKSGGTVFVPLKADDPLIPGPDHILGNADDLPASQRFMVLTRARNQPGPDGQMGTSDDVQEATNTDSPWVDQSQTYTSHPAHQVFLREYTTDATGRTVSDGRMLRGDDGGMATWKRTKAQAATLLGIRLTDADVLNIPLLATDQYGRYLRGPDRGLPQIVVPGGLVEGNTAVPIAVPDNARRLGTAFLDDIAHHAVPKPGLDPDPDTAITAADATQPAGTYDDEMLDRHFIAGDGRVNENIGLTAVHQIFHSEHNRLVDYIEGLITAQNIDVAEWQLPDGSWNGERIFQAARFVTEMEYQHLVFEEFARKVQPAIDPFNPAVQSQTDINPAIKAEFAHAVYRFGHSMLTDTVSRVNNATGHKNDIGLIEAFLNPPAYNDGGADGTLSPDAAAGAIAAGMTDQVGNELDEFVTEALRNNLLGLPLDLPTINMTRAREAGIPSLNDLRKHLFKSTNDGSLKPYTDWVDFGLSLKHRDSVVNFMAAYGTHPSITSKDKFVDKRAAAQLIFDDDPVNHPDTPADAAEFVNSTGAWSNDGESSRTGLDDVDLWIGGLAESQNLFGGLLGSTFNYVFEQQLTDLQNGDRMYYLSRTPGLNLRTQLEGNSFAELIMRNTDAQSLKADVFGAADCEFDLKNLQGTTPGTITDDPTSPCDESALLIRMADGTIRYRQTNAVDPPGLNAQSTYNGTPNADRIHGGVDNDTFWGNQGADRIEGNDGADVALGGDGNDVITDSAGDDNLKGGDGNDAIDSGPGLDLIQSGFGADFTDGGLNGNETFAGEGNDITIAGNGPDTVEGDGGDDWMEGGNSNDLLQGDNGAPFFDDLNNPGNDVLIGDGGEDDYDAEGGDDIMLAGPGVERNAGILGFDWVTHARDPQPADADLNLKIALPVGPVVTTRDRYTQVEAASGGNLDDSIKGNIIPPAAGDELTQEGIARIDGLQDVVGAGVTSFNAGDILLGGGGNDVIEGRQADDIIDGDKWLNVLLRAPDLSTPDTTDTKLVTSATAVRNDVFTKNLDPGDIHIVRRIETAPAGSDVDTAVFSGPRADYDLTITPTQITVAHARGAAIDGTDTVRNVERLRFADQTVTVGPAATPTPTALTFAGQLTNTTSAAQTATLTNTGTDPLTLSAIALTGANAAEFTRPAGATGGTCARTFPATVAPGANCTVGLVFRPTGAGARTATLRFTDNARNVAGSTQDVGLSGTGVLPVPVASLTPATQAFPDRLVNQASPAQTTTLRNTGNGPLTITGIGLAGAQSNQFARSGGTCPTGAGSLGAGATCTITVTFRPTSVGAKTATLQVTDDSNNTTGSVQSTTLSGTGVPPAPGIAVTTTALNFGANAVGFLGGLFAPTRTVQVTSSGTAPLTLSGVTIIAAPAASAPANYTVTGNTCGAGPRAVGSVCTITVRFRATATGTRNAILNIASNAPTSPTRVSLTGTGV